MSEIWPNFFIVGADKAGTSSLYSYLNEIPEIFMSKIKEPNYFSKKTFPDNPPLLRPIRDKKKYLDLFKNVKDQKIIGEASPSYLADPDAPKLIHQISPDAKILISLRDPVDRIFSNYLMLYRIGRIKSSFDVLIQRSLINKKNKKEDKLTLNNGLYFENVNRYISIFSKDKVKIIIFEELIQDLENTLKDILNFLNLKSELVDFKPDAYNKYGVVRGPLSQKVLQNKTIRRFAEVLISPSKRKFLKEKFILKEEKKPEMNNNVRKLLVNYYTDDVQKIKNFLNRDLPWKNF